MLKKYLIKNKKICNNDKGNIFYFHNLDENEKNQIVKNFGIDINTVNSALDPEEPARFEIEKEGNINIIWKMPVFF